MSRVSSSQCPTLQCTSIVVVLTPNSLVYSAKLIPSKPYKLIKFASLPQCTCSFIYSWSYKHAYFDLPSNTVQEHINRVSYQITCSSSALSKTWQCTQQGYIGIACATHQGTAYSCSYRVSCPFIHCILWLDYSKECRSLTYILVAHGIYDDT